MRVLTTIILALVLGLTDRVVAQESDFCSNAQQRCSAMMTSACMSAYAAGAKEADTSTSCKSQIDNYRGCVRTIADLCGGSPATANSTPPPETDHASYCTQRRDDCTEDIRAEYTSCRSSTSSGSCRSDCQDARDDGQDSCTASYRACISSGSFSGVQFDTPYCVAEPSPPPNMSTICRWNAYYCTMFQPGIVGTPCTCVANPFIGNFNGIVSTY